MLTGVFSFTVPPLQLQCGAKGGTTNGVAAFMILECSAINAQGPVSYVCDVDAVFVPCEWSTVMYIPYFL